MSVTQREQANTRRTVTRDPREMPRLLRRFVERSEALFDADGVPVVAVSDGGEEGREG